MRIVLDLQGAQSESSRFRGVCRYTVSFAEALCSEGKASRNLARAQRQIPGNEVVVSAGRFSSHLLTSVLVHDLIPFLHPETFLTSPALNRSFKPTYPSPACICRRSSGVEAQRAARSSAMRAWDSHQLIGRSLDSAISLAMAMTTSYCKMLTWAP